MDAKLEHASEVLASDVLKEAVAEATGRSSRKWAVVVVALALGAALAVLWMRSSRH